MCKTVCVFQIRVTSRPEARGGSQNELPGKFEIGQHSPEQPLLQPPAAAPAESGLQQQHQWNLPRAALLAESNVQQQHCQQHPLIKGLGVFET